MTAFPRGFYCTKMREKSKSTTFLYYIDDNFDEKVSVTAMTAALVTGKPVSSALRWKAADPVVFHLLNRLNFLTANLLISPSKSNWKFEPMLSTHLTRETGKRHPIKYQSSPFFYLHTINAYEEDGHLVIDICCYARCKSC